MTETLSIDRDGITIHSEALGPKDGPVLVLANSLGTTLHLWDGLIPHLPQDLRIIRYDLRGHGKTSAPDGPYTMGALVADAEAVLEAHGVTNCVFLGLSVGGLIAQGLAVKRLDLIRAMILSNTGAKIGTKDIWDDRINTVLTEGIPPMLEAIMDRWFTKDFAASPESQPWRDMLLACPPQGYAGCSAAISGTDFYATTATLRLPTLAIAGDADGATPPDLVFETAGLIPGAETALIRNAGHLPHVEDVTGYAGHVTDFLKRVGHI